MDFPLVRWWLAMERLLVSGEKEQMGESNSKVKSNNNSKSRSRSSAFGEG